MTPEDEERGWEELQARWTEEEAHRAWLAGFTDLEGLARAGQRYRARLSADGADAVAKRWLDEVVKRATVHGLASLPKTRPPTSVPRWLMGAAIAVASSVAAWALWWIAQQLLGMRGR